MNVLIILAHPDDEVLGVGGTMALHTARGDVVHVLIVADGESSRANYSAEDLAARQENAFAAAKVLGTHSLELLGFPDQRLDSISLLDIVQKIEAAASRIEPAIVYTHHSGDLNMDHRIVANAVMTAFRPLLNGTVRTIYACEIMSSTEWATGVAGPFVPRRFVDISTTLDKKIEALRCYESELRDFPHPRSYKAIEALAQWRGASAGLAAAEAFDIMRDIDRV